MTEFVIVLPVFILLIFGAIQVALIFSAKTTLNYATFQAARLGAVNNATYSGIRKGLIRGLAPLFTTSTDRLNVLTDIKAGIENDFKKNAATEVDGFVRIIRVNPTQDDFADNVSGHGERNSDGILEIPSDNLMYRSTRVTGGQVNIQDANLLKIKVQYCYELMVPMVNRLIGSLSELNNTRPSTGYADGETFRDPRFADLNRFSANQVSDNILASYEELCSGRSMGSDRSNPSTGFVISSEAIVRMQSPALSEDDDEEIGDKMCDGDHMTCP